MLPDWWEDDYYEHNKPQLPKMSPEKVEAKKIEIRDKLESLRVN